MLKATSVFAVCLALVAAPAAGQEVFAVTIKNPNNVPIQYQVRAGEGQWQSKILPQGYRLTHTWTRGGRTLAIRFDSVAADGQVTPKFYELEPNATYVFRYLNIGRYVDLYAE